MSHGVQSTPNPTSGSIDFLILTPLQEERDAVLRCLGRYSRLPPSKQDIRVYSEGEAIVPTVMRLPIVLSQPAHGGDFETSQS